MQDKTWDVIIVGGGTAGCVLATRLSARPDLHVLLIESGSDRTKDPKALSPLVSRAMFEDSDYDWCFNFTPQEFLNGRIIQNTRGRMLGGSSAINSHSLVYPNKAMHDWWADIAGDKCWSWEHMARYYQLFQTEQTSQPGHKEPVGSVQASLGAKPAKSGPSEEAIGGFTTTNSIDGRSGKGERSFAGNTYLAMAMHRENLIIEADAVVENFIFDRNVDEASAWLRAVGVHPQILELPGIGSRKVLETVGVECLLDAMIENLQDHLHFGPNVEVLPSIETMDFAARDLKVAAAQREEYAQRKTGPLSEVAAYSYAHWQLQLFNTPADEEALGELLKDVTAEPYKLTQRQYDFTRRMIVDKSEGSATVFMIRKQRYTNPGAGAPDGNYMIVIAMLAHPLSRGSVHIQRLDPTQHPCIDNGFLTHPLDVEILARHVLQIETFLAQDTYSAILRPNGRHLPAAYDHTLRTAGDVNKAIKEYGATNHHPFRDMDVIRVDSFYWPYEGEWKSKPLYWPDPDAVIAELRRMGIELVVSIWPTVDRRSESYQEMLSKGLLISQGRDPVKGVRVFWLDEAEPEFSRYDFHNYRYHKGPNQMIGNTFPKCFGQAFYESMKSEGQEDVITW
ncbi:choline dehydrogenase [Paramyrothecium foliicola]|nr:choline dehydrogenase [Paramyrothecium foliicola]